MNEGDVAVTDSRQQPVRKTESVVVEFGGDQLLLAVRNRNLPAERIDDARAAPEMEISPRWCGSQ